MKLIADRLRMRTSPTLQTDTNPAILHWSMLEDGWVEMRRDIEKLLAVAEAADRLISALDLGDPVTQANRKEDLESALGDLEEEV